MSLEYKIPRILWENLESVLLAHSRRYISELAKRLGVSDKELQKKVLPSKDSLKVIIQDTQSESNKCKAYIQHSKLTIYCRKPTVYGSDYCAFHRSKRMTVIHGTEPLQLQRLKDNNELEPLWINNTTVYNADGNIRGKINTNEAKLKIFIVST